MGEPLRAVCRFAGCVKLIRGESGIRRSRCVPGRGRGGSRPVLPIRQGSGARSRDVLVSAAGQLSACALVVNQFDIEAAEDQCISSAH